MQKYLVVKCGPKHGFGDRESYDSYISDTPSTILEAFECEHEVYTFPQMQRITYAKMVISTEM